MVWTLYFIYRKDMPAIRLPCTLSPPGMYPLARLFDGRILRFWGVVLSITVRSQYADPNRTPWEKSRLEVWSHQLSLESFDLFDMFHQTVDQSNVFRGSFRGGPVEDFFLYSLFSKITSQCNIPDGNQRDEPLTSLHFSYRTPLWGTHLGNIRSSGTFIDQSK